MDPDQFRESRLTINRLCDNIVTMLDEKNIEKAKAYHSDANDKLDLLRSQAEGEIQKRSVKNLGSKVNILSIKIQKMKPASSDSKRKKTAGIVWNEGRIATLSPGFLLRVLENMGTHNHARVCFGTSGKGIRPNYQILLGPEKVTAYSGSSHAPLTKTIDGKSGKLSHPFPREAIEKALNQGPPAA